MPTKKSGKMDLEIEEQELQRIGNTITFLEETVEAESKAFTKAEAKALRAKEAQEVLQHLAQAVQQQAHRHISKVVTSCLASVFDDPYEFKITFEQKRGKTEAHLRFVRDTLDLDPLASTGGGAVDVAAFALRVSCLVLHRPRLSRVVILDEPFRFVSAQYQDRIRTMLENLSKDMEIQVIFVTHNERYITGKVIDLG